MNNKKSIRLTEQDLHRIINEAVTKIINGNFAGRAFNDYIKKAYQCVDMRNKYILSKAFPDLFGYNNYWKVLNAKDYGIPQNRERVFVVSIRKDIDKGTFS